MKIENSQNINPDGTPFPLNRLLRRLQTQADFDITPADLLAVQRLIQTQTSLLLNPTGRQELQYLLAPILCKSRTQQAQFYTIYQTYLAEDLQQEVLPTTSSTTTKKSNLYWYSALLLGLLGLLFLVYKFGFKEALPTAKIQFERPKKQLHIGDTLRIKNISLVDAEIPVIYEWAYLDKKNKQIEQQQNSLDFKFTIPPTGQDYLKTIRLVGRDSLTQKILGVDSTVLSIYCENSPIINTITIGDTLLTAGTPLPFSAEVAGDNLAFHWQFGDGDTATLFAPVHTYEKNGNYLIKLTVSDTLNRFGKCESSLQTYLKLEAKKLEETIIASTPFTLQKEPPKTVLQSKAWAYIILMLLLTGAAWSWLQWLMRPLLETAPKDYFKARVSKSAKPLTELIQPTFLQFEIANLLRKRQAGRRKEMALAKTLQATVEKGGYSELHYQFKTKPTEYLALVDLTNHTKDQKALANYLPDFFSKQDVLIHSFFYENDFDKIWSTRFPKGISLRKLYEFYPENRLLIFGNTQQLVHNWQQHQQLPKAWEQLSNQWEHQVVCTNTAIPDQLFATLPYDTPLSFFPANLSGIGQAIDFLEEKVANDSEQEATWVNQTKSNPSANQSFDEAYHTLFQNKYPKIYQWFLALNVYPSADLSTVIAIGKTLKIEATYDNLQLIAPIANLQKNNFDKTLWLNNWEKLTITEERLARQAIVTELKNSLTPTTKKIDAATLKNNLIIQEFALQPFEVEQQKKVRYLYQTEQLSDLQLTELDLIVQRHTTNYRTGKINGETFVNFLNDELKKRKKVSIPWNIPYFWWAVGLSLAALLFGSSMYFSDGDLLNNRFHIAKSEAARLNNLAVDYYTEELPLPEKQATNSNKFGINFKGINLVSTTASQFLEQAILVDSIFEKAHLNYQKLMYNDGLKHYQSYVENNTYPLAKAKYPLTQAIKYHQFKDTIVYHSAMLALANIHHLLNEQDSVCQLLEVLNKNANEEILAKVQRLKKQAIYCADQPVTVLLNGQVVDAKTLKGIEGVLIQQKNKQGKSGANGYYQLAIIKVPNQTNTTLTFSQAQYQSTSKTIELTKANLAIPPVQLMPLSSVVYAVNGQIINEQTGAAIPNIAIGGTSSNQDGYFSYSYTPTLGKTGEMTVNIKASGYLPYEKTMAVEKMPKQLIIELEPQVSSITLSAFDFPVPVMIMVPGGTFTMGCTPEQEYVCQLDERPAHQVKLDSFEIGKYEVTNEEFATFLNDYGGNTIKTGAYTGKPLVKADPWGVQLAADGTWQPVEGYSTHPAIGMAQYGAVEYCKWLSEKTEQHWRLPTEAEWEYAARGGPKKASHIFAGSNNLAAVAWCYENSFEKGPQHPNYGTNPVGQRKANTLGIHDMSGNVFEWINGWYQADIYEQHATKIIANPEDATAGKKRMLRGGSWYLFSKDDTRVSNRISVPATTQGNISGFRVVRVWK